jgi:hypothetical protein
VINLSKTDFPRNILLVAGSFEIKVEMVDEAHARSSGEVDWSFSRTGRNWVCLGLALEEAEVELVLGLSGEEP